MNAYYDAIRPLVLLTADQIADKMRALGIAGDHHPTSCPIAIYLFRCTNRPYAVAGTACQETTTGNVPDEGQMRKLPYSVVQFIQYFDEGQYLDLLNETARQR